MFKCKALPTWCDGAFFMVASLQSIYIWIGNLFVKIYTKERTIISLYKFPFYQNLLFFAHQAFLFYTLAQFRLSKRLAGTAVDDHQSVRSLQISVLSW